MTTDTEHRQERALYAALVITETMHQLDSCHNPTVRAQWRVALEWGRDVANAQVTTSRRAQ